jgi:hypothetical protein
MKKGRPSMPDKQEIQNAICDMIATSNKSLRSVLNELSKTMEGVPCMSTVMDWLNDKEFKEFAERYALAREIQYDFMAEQLLNIADDESLDVVFDDKDKASVDKEHITRSRLRVDARKWLLARLRPVKGTENKLQVEHSLSETNLASLSAVVRQEFKRNSE